MVAKYEVVSFQLVLIVKPRLQSLLTGFFKVYKLNLLE